jgi:hypothetical protein
MIKEDVNDHLPPIFLVFTVLACSGFVFMYSFRDVFATGRVIGGVRDHAYLVCHRNINSDINLLLLLLLLLLYNQIGNHFLPLFLFVSARRLQIH